MATSFSRDVLSGVQATSGASKGTALQTKILEALQKIQSQQSSNLSVAAKAIVSSSLKNPEGKTAQNLSKMLKDIDINSSDLLSKVTTVLTQMTGSGIAKTQTMAKAASTPAAGTPAAYTSLPTTGNTIAYFLENKAILGFTSGQKCCLYALNPTLGAGKAKKGAEFLVGYINKINSDNDPMNNIDFRSPNWFKTAYNGVLASIRVTPETDVRTLLQAVIDNPGNQAWQLVGGAEAVARYCGLTDARQKTSMATDYGLVAKNGFDSMVLEDFLIDCVNTAAATGHFFTETGSSISNTVKAAADSVKSSVDVLGKGIAKGANDAAKTVQQAWDNWVADASSALAKINVADKLRQLQASETITTIVQKRSENLKREIGVLSSKLNEKDKQEILAALNKRGSDGKGYDVQTIALFASSMTSNRASAPVNALGAQTTGVQKITSFTGLNTMKDIPVAAQPFIKIYDKQVIEAFWTNNPKLREFGLNGIQETDIDLLTQAGMLVSMRALLAKLDVSILNKIQSNIAAVTQYVKRSSRTISMGQFTIASRVEAMLAENKWAEGRGNNEKENSINTGRSRII